MSQGNNFKSPMAVNSSLNHSLYAPHENCSTTSISVLIAAFITYILFLLPVFILVLHVGYQRWRKQRSSSTAVMNSHSDIFTFNMVSLELFSIFGFCLFWSGTYSNLTNIMTVGVYIIVMVSPAQTLFHLLTCVDRYLAVVHPIAYLGLRQTSRVRIRNIIIGCVWMLSIISTGSMIIHAVYMIINILFLTFSSIITFLCTISVLCVLNRPGPGEMGRNRDRLDQSKQRAFYTIMAITGALFSRFLCILIFDALMVLSVISYNDYCSAMVTSVWLSLPSSLVLPLLFLHRAGKLPGTK